jgi:hypothetical protein
MPKEWADSSYKYLSPIRRGLAPSFVNYKKGALELQPQVIILPVRSLDLTAHSYKPITNMTWVRAQLCKLQKRCTRLAAASDKVWMIFFVCFSAIFSNISAISWRSALVVEEAGVPRENDPEQATGKLYHLRLRVECTFFVICKAGREPTSYWW